MSEDGRNLPETSADGQEKRSDARVPRTIRFSDPEWERVETAAKRRGIAAAEFARTAVLDVADGKSITDSATITPEIVELIKRTHRCAYIISTLKRDEMIQEGRGHEMDDMVDIARKAQAELLSSS